MKTDVVEMVVYAPSKVDHMLQESSHWDDCFAGNLQGTYKWLEVKLTHWGVTGKGISESTGATEFVLGKSGLHMSAIKLITQFISVYFSVYFHTTIAS